MPRARTLKPGFFSNDALAEVDPLGRLLFAGLWTIADRRGRLEDRPKRIKAELLPYDDVDIEALLADLADHGFITRYVVGGEPYIHVVTFEKHQSPHVREPESAIPAPDTSNEGPVLVLTEHRTSTRHARAQHVLSPADPDPDPDPDRAIAAAPTDRRVVLPPDFHRGVCAALGRSRLKPWEAAQLAELRGQYPAERILSALRWAVGRADPAGVVGYARSCIADAPWERDRASPNGAPVQQLEDIHDYLRRRAREYEGESE